MKNCNIAIIAPFGPQTGGMVELAKLLVSMFMESGFNVKKINKGLAGSNPLEIALLYMDILKATLACDYLVVVSSSGISLWVVDLVAVVLARVLKKKVIIDFVGGAAVEECGKWFVLKKWAFRMSSVVVVPTEKMLSPFIRSGIKANYEVIPHVVDLEIFNNIIKKPIENKLVVLSAKNFESYANIDQIIRSVASLMNDFPHMELWIAGGGREEKKLKALAETILPGRTVFLGNINHDAMGTVMAQVDILAHATKYESFGIVLVEAMAAGVPIVSYEVGGISEVVRDGITGILVRYGDLASMTEKIALLARNETDRREMGRRGTEESRKYSKEGVMPLWRELFDRWD